MSIIAVLLGSDRHEVHSPWPPQGGGALGTFHAGIQMRATRDEDKAVARNERHAAQEETERRERARQDTHEYFT